MRSWISRTKGDDAAARRSRAPPAPFISVAFTAGMFFVPLVIMTGLATEPGVSQQRQGDDPILPLRGTIDLQPLGLRPSED